MYRNILVPIDGSSTAGLGLHDEVEWKLIEAPGQHAGDLILTEAREWPADLIVCGTHGRRGLRRILMGSDAEYVVRSSPVPVLLIRGG